MACPQEPLPPGWQVWRGASVPPPLTQWAMGIRDRINDYPYGAVAATLDYNGQTVAAFKSHHSWTYRNGKLVTGLCIPGVSLLVPKPSGLGAAPSPIDLSTPDPTAAVFAADTPTDWRLVAVSGASAAVVVGLFFFAIHHVGRAKRLTGRRQ